MVNPANSSSSSSSSCQIQAENEASRCSWSAIVNGAYSLASRVSSYVGSYFAAPAKEPRQRVSKWKSFERTQQVMEARRQAQMAQQPATSDRVSSAQPPAGGMGIGMDPALMKALADRKAASSDQE